MLTGVILQRAGNAKSYLADGAAYAKIGNDLLAQGKIKTLPIRVAAKGLESINEEFKNMKEGKVRALRIW